jgi:hypothetical protein
MTHTLDEAMDELKRDPNHPVRARVGNLVVEVRVVAAPSAERSAADAFAELGPWEGESTEELLALLSEARRKGALRSVSQL